MTVVAIVQARMGSRRLPGKVLERVEGLPIIGHVFDRVRDADVPDRAVLTTSTSPADAELESWAGEAGIPCYRGKEHDVLDRYYRASRKFDADAVVRITGDCPLLDPDVVDRVAERYLESDADYVSNTIDPTFPDGLDVEVFSIESLRVAWQEARLASEREHVTPFITKRPDCFSLLNVRHERDLSEHRWTVDEPKDLRFVRELSRRADGLPVGLHETLEVIREHPELKEINSDIERNEGYQRSVEDDRESTDGDRDGH